MQSDHWSRVREIFDAALENGDERSDQFLIDACGDNAGLEKDVRELLNAYDTAGPFLETPVSEFGFLSDNDNETDVVGQKIGPYDIVKLLGQGGFGQVFVANQTEPVQRQVALKLIRPGMGSREVIARFNVERQTLAVMNHPNIACVFDAGSTRDGQPYFVMELVEGFAINEFCNDRGLSGEQRLSLFLHVCNGIEHAHKKGIIHRDLKPSNILVTEIQDKPVPKIIDFGIAKAIDQSLDEGTALTRETQVIGTPLYMSPEQAGLSSSDIDTRSDVYSLGVVLYELLTGTTPLDRAEMKRANLDEFRRMIREVDPPKPSSRATTRMDAAFGKSTVSLGKTDASRLSRMTRGDLDWIVMKSLEKDRERRYQSVNEFADDIQRFLNHEPVSARPPSQVYRVQKFFRKNRTFCFSAAAILLTLIGATGFSTYQAVRATRAVASETTAKQNESIHRLEAEKKALEAEQARASEAIKRRQAEGIRDTFVSIFRSPHPFHGGHKITVREKLDEAMQVIEERFAEDPETHLTLLQTIGGTYQGMGMYDEALLAYQKAFAIMPQAMQGDREAVELLCGLATCHLEKRDARVGHAEAARAVEVALREFGPQDRLTLKAQRVLSVSLFAQGKLEQSFELVSDVFKQFQQNFDEFDEDYLQAENDMAVAFDERGQHQKGIPMLREVLKKRIAQNGEESVDAWFAKIQLVQFLSQASEVQQREAVEMCDQILERADQYVDATHPLVFRTMAAKSEALANQKRYVEAIEHQREVIKKSEALGKGHHFVVSQIRKLATYFQKNRQYAMALTQLEQAEQFLPHDLGESNAAIDFQRAEILFQQEKFDEAETQFAKIAEYFETKSGAESVDAIVAHRFLAQCYVKQEKFDAAHALLLQTLDDLIAGHGELHPKSVLMHHLVGASFQRKQDPESALQHFKKSYELATELFGPTEPWTIEMLNVLAMAYSNVGDREKTKTLLLQAVELSERNLGPNRREGLKPRFNLAALDRMQGKHKDAIKLLKYIVEAESEVHPFERDEEMFLTATGDLASNYMLDGDLEHARPAFKAMMDRYREHFKDDPNQFANFQVVVGGQLNDFEMHETAEALFDESIAIRERIMPGTWLNENTKSILGQTKMYQAIALQTQIDSQAAARFDEAEKLLLDSYAGLVAKADSIPDRYRRPRLTSAVRRIIKYYKTVEQPDEVEKWEATLKEVRQQQ